MFLSCLVWSSCLHGIPEALGILSVRIAVGGTFSGAGMVSLFESISRTSTVSVYCHFCEMRTGDATVSKTSPAFRELVSVLWMPHCKFSLLFSQDKTGL